MENGLVIVTQLPLEQLWRKTSAIGLRGDLLGAERITQLLREGSVAFVVADIGHEVEWIVTSECYEFWKREVKHHLATDGSRITPDQFPDAYCYLASDWGLDGDGIPIIVLERYH